jgi:uncharacterized protein with von Willebrand factor type A (vWA) domain
MREPSATGGRVPAAGGRRTFSRPPAMASWSRIRAMEGPILEFVRALRASGIRVSPTEAADALGAAVGVGLEDRNTFRSALRATLLKRELDRATFEELFSLHFSPFGAASPQIAAPTPIPELRPLPREALEALGPELQALLDRILAASDLELALLARQAGGEALRNLDSLLQQGLVARAALDSLGAAGADAALDRLAAALGGAGWDEAEVRAWRDLLRDELERLRAAVRGVVREQYDRVDAERRRERRAREISRSTLGSIGDHESAQMRMLVERLGHKLDSLPELRRRRHRHGALDPQRTWRANLQSGAIPFRLRWREHPRRKPQVVALCDISNSMQSTVRFLLHFLYRLQDRFSRVRTFVFVADVTEVTDEFRDNAVDVAIAHALEPSGFAYYSATNYGRAFEQFLRTYADAVTPRTITLILGDARGNHTPARAPLLADIGRRSRRLVWFNPEARLSWGLGDSSMQEYLPHCSQASEVRTLAHLEAAIDGMVMTPAR